MSEVFSNIPSGKKIILDITATIIPIEIHFIQSKSLLSIFNFFENKLSEARKIQTKRRYTDSHPAESVGKAARIRNKILEAIKDGKMTQDEFDSLVKELSSDHKRWMKRNGKMFNVSEDGISLSKFGQRILNGIKVNESFASFISK